MWSEGRRNGADDEREALHVLLEKLARVVNENRARIEELERSAQRDGQIRQKQARIVELDSRRDELIVELLTRLRALDADDPKPVEVHVVDARVRP